MMLLPLPFLVEWCHKHIHNADDRPENAQPGPKAHSKCAVQVVILWSLGSVR